MSHNNPYNALSVVHPKAKIGQNVHISPFCYIEEDVVIGDNCWIAPNVSILKGARIGNECRIFQGAIVSSIPQDLKFENEYSTLEIGNNVTIREYCTLNRGTKANHTTKIGDNCLLMAYVHVAHDCVIGKNCVLANNVTLAGHVEVGDWVVLGGLVAVHQFVKIGDHAMLSGGSLVSKDVPPFVKAGRNPLSYVGVNSLGLKRRGFSLDQINHIKDIFRTLFVKGYNVSQGVEMINDIFLPTIEREIILDFIEKSSRGLMRGLQKNNRISDENSID